VQAVALYSAADFFLIFLIFSFFFFLVQAVALYSAAIELDREDLLHVTNRAAVSDPRV
jgi:hypothetical protein